ncbi:MAG: 4-hydroxy-tetrahydrodipicolinate synthase [Pelagibacteraceae bacterium BACL5 MAG-120705-bin12]|jgi:4-hydroxy-tetrahydrodipicolinate synthase|nr:MAG: 4-hydroxy-tetrahydrodipicolinate synthase [Pelagibacteraceae bacterium BACL5 MAG-120705-bin12]KRO61006.1 MAG: 4-hydroxy-tetrahydrodipicolinate synthase [Pelagibacteraceae bacterium BACL5 MAG-121128-bin54]KRO64626.1 MAG: 4-hydroxy-tetrahydrodipicolinate synthase [Pelagibacteraceae bacterium BACL5 MAG-120820-bin39]
MQFNGIYTALITPFNQDFSINEKAYAILIDKIIAEGVHGIVLAGSTGENYSQTLEERIHLINVTAELINKKVKLIVGTGGILRIEDSIILGKKAKEVGADAIMISSPPYSVPTSKENALSSLAIDRATNLPILLYNYPGRTSVNMDKEYLDIISESKNFCAIKESSGEIQRIDFLMKNYPNIDLCCGMDDQAFDFFKAGSKSWVCAGSNFAAKAHIKLWNTCVIEKNIEKGKKIWDAMKPLMTNLEQGGKFIQSIKYGVDLKGIEAGPPRSPLLSLDDKEKNDLANVINKMNKEINLID